MSSSSSSDPRSDFLSALKKLASVMSTSDIERIVHTTLDPLNVHWRMIQDEGQALENKILFFQSLQRTLVREHERDENDDGKALWIERVVEYSVQGHHTSIELIDASEMNWESAWNDETTYEIQYIDRSSRRWGTFIRRKLLINREYLQDLWRSYQYKGERSHRDDENGRVRLLPFEHARMIAESVAERLDSGRSRTKLSVAKRKSQPKDVEDDEKSTSVMSKTRESGDKPKPHRSSKKKPKSRS